MTQVQDLSTLGQKKEGTILNLKFPSVENRPLTVKEFVEFSIYNFDQVGRQLKSILEYLKGQDNVNMIMKEKLTLFETVLNAWIEEAKKLESNEQKENTDNK
jgi:hypothetical protein